MNLQDNCYAAAGEIDNKQPRGLIGKVRSPKIVASADSGRNDDENQEGSQH